MTNISFFKPDITETEINEVAQALKSGWITTGGRTKKLESELSRFIGSERTVCLNSATACMEMTLRLMGIGPGDEVITSAYTYSASASVIHHVGAKIVLADTAAGSYEMDYESLGDLITEKTKAIIPVDYAGKMCDYHKIYQVVEAKKDLFCPTTALQKLMGRMLVIADSAHGIGASYCGRNAGTVADFSCFSFHAVKNLTTAEGGAVTWRNDLGLDNDEIYREFMLLSLHGQSKDAFSKTNGGSWEYDIVYPAYKCNMTDVAAAIGLMQLERYHDILAKRKQLIEYYDEKLSQMNVSYLDHYDKDHESSGHLYVIRIKGLTELQRNQVIEEMHAAGISCNVHYKPLPMFTAYKNLGFNISDYPNAFAQYENTITLPLYNSLSFEDIDVICSNLEKIISNYQS